MNDLLKAFAAIVALMIAIAIINVLYQAGLNIRADRINREAMRNHGVTEWRTPIGGCLYYVTPQGQYIPEFRGQGKELVCNKE